MMSGKSDLGFLLYACFLVGISAAGAIVGWAFPMKIIGLADHLISAISMLLGVSLAVTAVLATPITFAKDSSLDSAQQARIERIIAEDDHTFSSGLLIYFYLSLSALVGLLAVLFFDDGSSGSTNITSIKSLCSFVSFITSLTLVLAIRLPVLLVRSAKMRRWG